MANRGKDPFDFGLGLKGPSMAEMKKPPAPAAPPKPQAQASADTKGSSAWTAPVASATPVVNASDLDFLGGLASKPAPAASAPKPAAPSPGTAGSGLGMDDLFGGIASPAATKPAAASPQPAASGADPFDMFGDVHGAHAPIPATVAAPAAASGFGDDDAFHALADFGGPAAASLSTGTASPYPPVAPSFDAGFGADFPPSATYPSSTAAASPAPAEAASGYAPLVHEFHADFGEDSAFPPPPAHATPSSSHQPPAQGAPGPLERARPSLQPAPGPAEQDSYGRAGSGALNRHGSGAPGAGASAGSGYWSHAEGAASHSSSLYNANGDHHGYRDHSFGPGYDSDRMHGRSSSGQPYGGRSVTSQGSQGGGSGGGGGVLGMLKGFSKKAVQKAKEGLQQLESALERMDQSTGSTSMAPAAGAYGVPVGSTAATGYPASRQSGVQGGSSAGGGGYAPVGGFGRTSHGSRGSRDGSEHSGSHAQAHEDPRSIALTLMALPVEERRGVLGTLPPALRSRVGAVVAEFEAQAIASAPEHPRSHPGSAMPPVSVDVKTSAVSFVDSPSAPAGFSPVQAPGFGPAPATASSVPGISPVLAGTPPTSHAAAVHDHHEDLLGMGHSGATSASAAPLSAAPAAVDDLLGFGPGPDSSQAAAPPPAAVAPAASTAATPPAAQAPVPQPASQPAHHPVTADVDDMHDFFAGGSSASATPATMSHANSVHDMFSVPTASSAGTPAAAAGGAARPGASSVPRPRPAASAAVDLMAGLHDDVDTSAHQDLYEDTEGTEGEPELRRQLRAARLAEKHAKMRAALAEKQAKDEEEARRREQQVELKSAHKANVDTWKNRNKGNIRGLLGSLQTVLWEGSGWAPVGVGDMLERPQIRKVWMRANLLVHPDKVRQRDGSPEQVAIADMIFDVLKDAWNEFEKRGQ